MIRAITFDKQLMKSEDFAHITRYFYQGKMGVTKGCEISEDASGNIVISDGYFSIYGRYLKVEGEEVIEVPQIPSGVLYSILVFEIDLSKENTIDEFAQGHFKIISDVSGYPTPIQEDLENGGTIYQLEFCRFENTVAGAVNLVDTRTILSLEMYTLQEDFMTHLAEETQKHIAESGENTNGRYIKFDNGTMICYAYKNINSNDYEERNAVVSNPIMRSRIPNQPFPHSFIECFHADFKVHGGNDITLRNAVISTKLSFGSTGLSVENTVWSNPAIFHIDEIPKNATATFSFFAIGRWK